ncbi:TIGR03089 family protein [Luteococcus japonicus]|uniref:TIGR03089 family protein n=1 Tax=Luteococcus japonicus LSP_Lj1 TaxID=1255658 RepID=A0A1R4JCV0_9ACTN|nr:TIGR03089 family protein [Luteococcus japonicus]SJN29543.1 hypothetical protein FM114_06695 [Luteococcus japonicus LSP_Lj1]
MSNAFCPITALEQRVHRDGAQPLLTCYDEADGSRVEFSARTLANWVDKTANLIEAVGLDEGSELGLPLLLSHPGHWVGLVWTLAAWQVGATVFAVPRDDLERVELAVVGPENPHPVPGVETVVCSLHPLGAGLPTPVAGVTDYAEVLSQPDVHWRNPAPQIWLDDGEQQVGAEALAAITPAAGRNVVLPGADGPWADLGRLLLAPLAGGGSVVVVNNCELPDRLEAIAAAERADLGPK